MKVKKTGRKLDSDSKSKILEETYLGKNDRIVPSKRFLDYTILIYGESAIGKTTLVSKIPDNYIVQCDPNRKGLSVRQTNIPDMTITEMKQNRDKPTPWELIKYTFKRACEDQSVRVVSVDNFGMMYEHCLRHKCFKLGINDPTEQNDYGQTWRDIEDEMVTVLNSVNTVKKGLVLITHDDRREIELPDETVVERIQPSLMKAPFKFVKAVTDYAFFLSYTRDHGRVINIRTGSEIWTKCCVDEEHPHFNDPDGVPLKQVSAGSSATECWANLCLAWENKIYDVSHSERKLKKKKKFAKAIDK